MDGDKLVTLLVGIIGKTPDERATMLRQVTEREKVLVIYQNSDDDRFGAVTVALYDRSDVPEED